MCPDKDPGTCCVYRRGWVRSPCSTRIPADNLRTDYPHSRAGRCTTLLRSVPYTLRSVRKGTVRRGSVSPVESAPLKGIKSSRTLSGKQTEKRNDTIQTHGLKTEDALTLLQHALRERVSGVARHTHACGRVAHHSAFCIRSARSGTWVSAFEVHARQVTCALAIAHAFRPTVGRRARVIGQARA
jgi:hypothetical protein